MYQFFIFLGKLYQFQNIEENCFLSVLYNDGEVGCKDGIFPLLTQSLLLNKIL
jgi:hypothetical protein